MARTTERTLGVRYSTGSYDRRSAWDHYFSNNVVNKIVLANVVMFLLQQVLGFRFTYALSYQPTSLIQDFKIWQPLTYMFLHADFFHLFFNMLMLWFLGTTVESAWGGRKFLKYYIATGLGGALFFTIFNYGGSVYGASGAVFGIMVAYAMMFPDNYLLVYFIFPVKAKYMVGFLVLLNLAYGVSGAGGIAYFAHLGGAAVGLLFFRREISNSMVWRRTQRSWQEQNRSRQQGGQAHEGEKINSILDKIASKGYENLSTTEKRILENYSRQQSGNDE